MVRNIIHLGLGQVATTLLSILLTATLARSLGPSDYGLLFLTISIAAFVYVIVEWGYGPLIIREAARHPARSGDLLGSSLAGRTVVAVLACPLAVATTWLLGYDVRTRVLTGVLILGWLPQYLGMSFGWIFRAYERMDRDAALNVVLKVVTLTFSVACLALGGHLLGLVFAWSFAGCVTLAVAIAMYRNLDLPRLSATTSTARELLRAGVPMFAMSLAGAVEPFLNANILYKLASSEVVGWYGAAMAIAGTLIAPVTILGATMYPRLSKAAGDAAEFKRAFTISFRPILLLAVLGAVGTYLFAEVPIGLVYSLQKFGPSADTLRAFAPALLLMYVDVFMSMAILAAGRASRLALAKLASVVFTAGLTFALVPLYQARFDNGGLGAMYAMAIGELLMLVASGLLVREVFDGRTIGDVCRTLLAGAVTVLLFRSLPELPPLFGIPLCVLVFAGLSLLGGAVKRSDVEILAAAFRKSPANQVD
jgi:PST family polysaccharide transporter